MPSEEEVARFIQASFQSVWAVELLCILRKHAPMAIPPAELVSRLQASDLVVSRSIQDLLAAGLVIVEQCGDVRYGPVNSDTAKLVEEAEALYVKSAHRVRRLIASSRGITAFSDAFKLRGDK